MRKNNTLLCFGYALLCLLLSCPIYAQSSKNSRINVVNSQQPAVVDQNLCNEHIDDGYIAIIPGWHRRDSLISDNTTDIVGKIPYTSHVDANGKLNINIPLEDFATQYELSPKLSLDYDGGSDSFDFIGFGWQLNGVPVIEKTVSNFYTDGNVDRFSSDSASVLTLNGVRLIKQNDSLYLSQTGNTKVIKTSPKEFKVMYEDGSIAIFSCEDNYVSNFARLRYYIRKIVSLDGQTITYNYKMNGDHYLFGNRMCVESIAFGNGRQFVFHYNHKIRVDNGLNPNYSATKYVNGTRYNYYFKIDTIDVTYGSQVLTRYQLHYKDAHVESPLSSITRVDVDGKKFKSLDMTYGIADSISTWESKSYTLGSYLATDKLANLNFRVGNFDYGSANEGLMMFPKKDAYTINDCNLNQFKSNYTSLDTLVVSVSIPNEGTAIPCGKIGLTDTFVEALAMNVDGKSGDEVVVIKEWSHPDGPNSPNTLWINIYSLGNQLSNKNYSMFNPRSFTIACEQQQLPKSFLTGDFDGDGKDELLALSHQITGTGATVRLIDMHSQVTKGTFQIDSCHVVFPQKANEGDDIRATHYWDSDRLFTTDYNGDGKPELCVMNKSGLKFYSFRYAHSGSLFMEIQTPIASNSNCIHILNTDSLRNIEIVPGDFNGDGCTDFVIPVAGLYYTPIGWTGLSDTSVSYRVLLGNGNGQFFSQDEGYLNLGMMRDGVFGNTLRQAFVTDVNRDGVSDLVFEIQNDSTIHAHTVIFRNGIGHSEIAFTNTNYNESTLLIPGKLLNISATDNKAIMLLSPDGVLSYHKLSAPADIQRCLTGIGNNQGDTRTFSYTRAYRANNFPIDTTPANQNGLAFPFASCADGRLVCVNEQRKSENQLTSSISYQYNSPVVHLQGIGFCGFREVMAADTIRGMSTYQTFDPEKFGAPIQTISSVDNQQLKSDTYSHTLMISDDKRIKNLLTSHTEHRFDTDVTITETFGHDEYGNIVTDTICYDSDGTSIKTIRYNNIASSALNLIGQVAEVEQTITRGNSTTKKGETKTYNSHHLLATNTEWVGEAKLPTKTVTFTYDNQKRNTKVVTQPFTGEAVKKVLSFESNSRTPRVITEENGITTRYVYGGFGITQSVDITNIANASDEGNISEGVLGEINPGIGRPYGLVPGQVGAAVSSPTTKYQYDSFGRLDSVTCAYGGGIKQILEWSADSDSTSYVLTVKEDGEPIKKIWYDSFDRKKREAVQRPDGSFLMTEYVYDLQGRLSAKSEPFKTLPSQWTTYTYDTSNRPLSINYPDGHSDNYQYNGLSTSSNVEGRETTTTVDAMGFITGVSEGNANASHIEYTYRADGNPLQVMLGGMISTTFEYDDYGRQTAINDPSAGRRERTYDASGRIATETDARGKSVSYTYNKYGLPVSETIDGVGTMEYAYDAHSNLTSMKVNGNVMRTYSYDDYSRVTSMKEGDFEKKMDYVGKNVTNVAYLLNNSQICAEQHLRSLGWLSAVNVNNVNVWRLIDENEKGLPTVIGCGVLSQWLSYDSAGRITGRKVRHATQPFIQNVAYEYDNLTGNMTQRIDSIYGHAEAFAYDSMNRLTAGGSDAYAYDTKGNVTYRDGMGSYGYTSARPYAVNHVPFSTMIPQREQHIVFNALQMPDSISEGGAIATFSYGADLQRSTMSLSKDGTTTTTRYYDGSLNTFTRTSGNGTAEKQVLYIGGDAYSAPAAFVRDFGSTDWQLRHIVRDNQGSIVAIADTTGNVLERNDYDPWGVLRNPLTQAPYGPADHPSLMLGRGYCGHEHLPEFGLINMNARLYDPALCRFLSPDPIVQAPTDPQNFNRYTYCLNNPLRYTDPSGMIIYDYEHWSVELDEVVVVAKARPKILLPFGVNSYTPQDPNVWLTFYVPQRDEQQAQNANAPYLAGGNASSNPNLASILLTSTSFPVNTINQHWNTVLRLEARQIAQMRQAQSTSAAVSQQALRAKEAQYKSLSKSTSTLKGVSRALTIVGGVTVVVDAKDDINNGHVVKAVARSVTFATITFSARIPYIGPFVSVSLGIADAFYGERFYDWVDSCW